MSNSIPAAWCELTVKEAFHLGRGRVISKPEMRRNPGPYPVYSSQSKNNGKMGAIGTYDFDGEYITWTTDGAYAGTVFHRTGKFNCTNVCGTLKDNGLHPISTKFVAIYLSTVAKSHVSYVGNPKLMNGTFADIPFLSPPLPEQKKIAAILSSVDEVIEKTRAQIDKLKDLKTGMMQELLTKGIGPGGVPHTEFKDSPVGRIPVGWESYLLGDVFDLKNGVNKDKDAFGHGVPIISYRNVYVGGGILDSDLSALVEMNEKELSRFRVHYGDVFFTRTSETPDEIGFSNVYLGRRDDVVFNGFVIRARQKNGLFHPNFLKYVFQSNAVRKQMIDNSKFTTRAGISGESLGRIAIAVPDISEQKNIANALNSVEARITKTINKINAIQSLKKALMQDLLTGKVRVNVDARELADD